MILNIPIWHNSIDSFLLKLITNKSNIETVILECIDDILYNFMGGKASIFYDCLEFCSKHNIPVKIVTIYSEKYNPILADTTHSTNVEKIYWEMYYFYKTFKYINASANINQLKNLDLDVNNNDVNLNTSFDYSYICLNHRVKNHRSQLLDLLYKNNLFSSGAISFRDVLGGCEGKPNDMTNAEYMGIHNSNYFYKFKYWKPELILLDHKAEIDFLNTQFVLPKEHNQSFMQVVTESDENIFVITEKTCFPLLYNKPFLICGSAFFHKNLTNFGFVLYDEIFDYSFDNETDLLLRTEGIIENVRKISSLTTTEKQKAFNNIKDKLLYNRQIALKHTLPAIPNSLYETLKYIPK